jgi:hypothetical protein
MTVRTTGRLHMWGRIRLFGTPFTVMYLSGWSERERRICARRIPSATTDAVFQILVDHDFD